MAKLVLNFQGAFIKEYPLDQPSVKIGRREGNDIQIDNLAVSGNHAKVQKTEGSYIIVDLRSTNGTFVNRKKIIQAKLNHGDEIAVGKHTLIFEDDPQEPPKEEKASNGQRQAGEKSHPQESAIREEKGSSDAAVGRCRALSSGNMFEITLEKKLTVIGRRDDADIRLKGPFAPKVAAYITRKPKGYAVLPEEKIKIRINGEPVEKQTNLRDGDVIEVGSLKLEFKES